MIVCGPGNNGGDGYVLAMEALKDDLEVKLVSVEAASSDTAQLASADYEKAGGVVNSFNEDLLGNADVVVDALLGTGTSRPVEGVYRDAIQAINQLSCPIMALDVPSGLNADTGQVMGDVIDADITVTFIGRKTGLYTGQGRLACGEILFDSLGADDGIYSDVMPDAWEAGLAQVLGWLPVRKVTAHKGDSGRLLVVGGDQAMSGAATLAASTAVATGAGLVRVATRSENVTSISAWQPELLVSGIDDATGSVSLPPSLDGILLGPGLGQSSWSRRVFELCLEHGQVRVIDADGLNLLAREPQNNEHWVLTPHPAEAARLLGWSTDDIMSDRVAAAKEISTQYGGVCVLKGSGTLITYGTEVPYICTRGGPGLATAGTGDVLSGMIASLIVQGMEPHQAAVAGVTLHALAGETTVHGNPAGMLASELIPTLREFRNATHA